MILRCHQGTDDLTSLESLFWGAKERFLSDLSPEAYLKIYTTIRETPPNPKWDFKQIMAEINDHGYNAKMAMLRVAQWYNPDLKEPAPRKRCREPIYSHLSKPFSAIYKSSWEEKALELQHRVINFTKDYYHTDCFWNELRHICDEVTPGITLPNPARQKDVQRKRTYSNVDSGSDDNSTNGHISGSKIDRPPSVFKSYSDKSLGYPKATTAEPLAATNNDPLRAYNESQAPSTQQSPPIQQGRTNDERWAMLVHRSPLAEWNVLQIQLRMLSP